MATRDDTRGVTKRTGRGVDISDDCEQRTDMAVILTKADVMRMKKRKQKNRDLKSVNNKTDRPRVPAWS